LGLPVAASNPVMPLPVKPPVEPGMGTILYLGGVTFHVWAPFASSVFAAGTFNEWRDATPFDNFSDANIAVAG